MSLSEQVAVHEAAHAVSALMEGPHVNIVEVSVIRRPGKSFGHMDALRDPSQDGDHIENLMRLRRALITSLVGEMAEHAYAPEEGPKIHKGTPIYWPPYYDEAKEMEWESLARIIKGGKISREEYNILVDLARDRIAEPVFRLHVEAVAIKLQSAGSLTGREVRDIIRDTQAGVFLR